MTTDENARLVDLLKRKIGLKRLIGQSPAFLHELEKVPLVAGCDASVLISGETGTGKELFARAIHYLSPRARSAFVPVNCSAIPESLAENELFGHERGAFTGAHAPQPGLVRQALGGTLLLDEVDSIPLSMQSKLLRFIEEKEYRSLGSARVHKADVRVLAASNSDLAGAVDRKRFRRDLYYRLNVIPLTLPPLRLRREDVPLLAGHFLEMFSREANRAVPRFSDNAMQRLVLHDWPGNVRELQNVIERAVVLSSKPVLRSADLDTLLSQLPSAVESFRAAKARVVANFEAQYVRGLLLANGGNISHAAKAAQKNRRAFFELMRKHNIDARQIKSSIA